jgi:hypothetical protein
MNPSSVQLWLGISVFLSEQIVRSLTKHDVTEKSNELSKDLLAAALEASLLGMSIQLKAPPLLLWFWRMLISEQLEV